MRSRKLLARVRGALPADPWDRATAALLVLLCGLAGATLADYGPTYDEASQREIGQAAVAWFRSGLQDRRALEPGPNGNYHLYGALFDGPAELAADALPLDPFVARHLVNVAWSLLGLLGAALLARRLGGPRAGLLALALLAATGAWWGHGFANPKDVPFAAPYPWILLTTLRVADGLPRPRAGRLVAAGVALGAALGVRPAGLSLLLPLVAGTLAARAVPLLLAAPPGGRARAALGAGWALAATCGVAWVVMLAAWPWGQLGPLTHPIVAARELAGSVAVIGVRFGGRWYTSVDLPRSYLPTWLSLTLPDAWLAAALLAAGGALAWRRRLLEGATLDAALVAAAGLLPVAAAVALRPPLYDGQRHFLFVLPALTAAVAAAASGALARLPRPAALAAAAVVGLAWLVGVADLAALHPYEYVAYNRAVAGGLARGAALHEGEYWGASVAEGARWLVESSGLGRDRPVAVASTAAPFQLPHALEALGAGGRFRVAERPEAELLVTTTRWFGHRAPGRVLHVVERQGVPLLYVIRLAPPGEAGPRRLPLGAGTLDLPLPQGWHAQPALAPGDPRDRFDLFSRGVLAMQLAVASPGAGAVEPVSALRAEVEAEAPPGAAVTRLRGPDLDGWYVRLAAGPGLDGALGALRCGPLALSFRAEAQPEELTALLAAVAGARPGPPSDRRP